MTRLECPAAMLDEQAYNQLTEEIRQCIRADHPLLDGLRADVRKNLGDVRRIQPRSTNAISLVGTDGGNNRVEFDPFMAQVIRVVDSNKHVYLVDVVTPTTDRERKSAEHLERNTPLGRMMRFLGAERLWQLSPMIPPPNREPKPSWVGVYRELTEWAVLLSLVREETYRSDMVVVCDGFLRSKVFSGELFAKYRQGLSEGIRAQHERNRCRVFVVGVAKHSKVLQRYRLAMSMEGVLRCDYPAYVEVTRELEEKVYRWSEYARGDETAAEGGEANKFVAGKLFFAKFGSRPRDPIWPVDIFQPQAGQAQEILGYVLKDALDGFPVPFFPRCLQRAHENAALTSFTMDIVQGATLGAIRDNLGVRADVLDELLLQDEDPSQRRYF